MSLASKNKEHCPACESESFTTLTSGFRQCKRCGSKFGDGPYTPAPLDLKAIRITYPMDKYRKRRTEVDDQKVANLRAMGYTMTKIMDELDISRAAVQRSMSKNRQAVKSILTAKDVL